MNHIDVADLQDVKQQKIKQFSELLDAITTTEDKKKALWKEIYENAISDRQNAFLLFHEAYGSMQNSIAEHIAVGPMLNKYIERMAKSNEQLIKLAELVADAEVQNSKIDPEDVFSKISD
jgi:hypothetical protein